MKPAIGRGFPEWISTENPNSETFISVHNTFYSAIQTFNLGSKTSKTANETLNMATDTLKSATDALTAGRKTLNSAAQTLTPECKTKNIQPAGYVPAFKSNPVLLVQRHRPTIFYPSFFF